MNPEGRLHNALHLIGAKLLRAGGPPVKLLGIALLLSLVVGFTARQDFVAASPMPEIRPESRVFIPLVMSAPTACLTPPCALSPADGATVDTLLPAFVWDAGEINSMSRLYICPTEQVPCACSDYFCFAGAGQGLHTFTPRENLPARRVWWAVELQYADPQGKLILKRSPTRSLEVLADLPLPLAPVLIGPSGTVTQTTVTFRWEPVAGALDYKLCLPGPKGLDCRVAKETELAVTFPRYEQGFEWWVEARNYYGYSKHNTLYLHLRPPTSRANSSTSGE